MPTFFFLNNGPSNKNSVLIRIRGYISYHFIRTIYTIHNEIPKPYNGHIFYLINSYLYIYLPTVICYTFLT